MVQVDLSGRLAGMNHCQRLSNKLLPVIKAGLNWIESSFFALLNSAVNGKDSRRATEPRRTGS